MDDSPPTTYIDRRIANAPYVMLLECDDGGPPMLIFSYRPLAEAVSDMFRAAIRNCKPVPTVLGRRAHHHATTPPPHRPPCLVA